MQVGGLTDREEFVALLPAPCPCTNACADACASFCSAPRLGGDARLRAAAFALIQPARSQAAFAAALRPQADLARQDAALAGDQLICDVCAGRVRA